MGNRGWGRSCKVAPCNSTDAAWERKRERGSRQGRRSPCRGRYHCKRGRHRGRSCRGRHTRDVQRGRERRAGELLPGRGGLRRIAHEQHVFPQVRAGSPSLRVKCSGRGRMVKGGNSRGTWCVWVDVSGMLAAARPGVYIAPRRHPSRQFRRSCGRCAIFENERGSWLMFSLRTRRGTSSLECAREPSRPLPSLETAPDGGHSQFGNLGAQLM